LVDYVGSGHFSGLPRQVKDSLLSACLYLGNTHTASVKAAAERRALGTDFFAQER
jgi:hypothetical protein